MYFKTFFCCKAFMNRLAHLSLFISFLICCCLYVCLFFVLKCLYGFFYSMEHLKALLSKPLFKHVFSMIVLYYPAFSSNFVFTPCWYRVLILQQGAGDILRGFWSILTIQICELHVRDANLLFHNIPRGCSNGLKSGNYSKKPVLDDLSFVMWCVIKDRCAAVINAQRQHTDRPCLFNYARLVLRGSKYAKKALLTALE